MKKKKKENIYVKPKLASHGKVQEIIMAYTSTEPDSTLPDTTEPS